MAHDAIGRPRSKSLIMTLVGSLFALIGLALAVGSAWLVLLGGSLYYLPAGLGLIRAIDIRTGETLWQDVLPAGGQATPMTYEAGGRQYVAVMAGGRHFMETPIGDALVAYALPAR